MVDQTWIKTTEGHFVAVDKITHISKNAAGLIKIYTVGSNMAMGTLPSPKAFFDAMTRGLTEEEVYG